MSDSKHTPGPWEAVDHEVTTVTKPWRIITNTRNDYDERDEDMANARLIAAAPELLAALTAAERAAWGDYSWMDDARAAIAKATGDYNA